MTHCRLLIEEELKGVELGDARLNRRALDIVRELSEDPSKSYPKVFRTDSQLEALYRFVNNSRVDFDTLIESHLEKSFARAEEEDLVRVAHDTTSFRFNDEYPRSGLGLIKSKGYGQGFFGHFALGVTSDSRRDTLGVLGVRTFARGGPDAPENESERWSEVVSNVRKRVKDPSKLIHLMDREADDYALLDEMIQNKDRFVVRHSKSRVQVESEMKTKEFMENVPVVCERQVSLSKRSKKRSGKHRKTHPPRDRRNALLQVSAAKVVIARPKTADEKLPAQLTLNLVRAFEQDPPDDECVDWFLLTTESIDTSEEILDILDHYCARWRIEEFFKCIKTGCSFQKRQLSSYGALLVALALTVPIAYALLRLRSLGRLEEEIDATVLFTDTQLAVLRRATCKPWDWTPTVQDAMFAVANLGGHIKRNGYPGWLTLREGFDEFTSLLQGVELAKILKPMEVING